MNMEHIQKILAVPNGDYGNCYDPDAPLTCGKLVEVLVALGAVTSHRKDERYCPLCQMLKPGWPDHWHNAGGKNLIYVCDDHDLETGGK